MGITATTLYAWIKQHPELSDALKKGKAPVDLEVENALLKRAMGYEYDEVIEEMDTTGKKHARKIRKHMPPDTAAAIFWLRNRKPKYWRQNPEPAYAADDPLVAMLNKWSEAAQAQAEKPETDNDRQP